MAKRIRVHIGAPDGVAGVFEFRADQPTMATAQSLSLLFTDHLGSVDLSVTIPGSSFLDFSGSATRQKFSYDAWGQRRDETDWVGERAFNGTQLAGLATDRGYTGHEMLDELGLVNMNARIYDPLLGRFLSADTVIPSPSNLQSYNRYSYVHNNALSYTDPTGHFLVSLFKGVSNFVKKYWKTIAVIALSVVTAGLVIGAYYGVGVAGGFSLMFGGSAMVGSMATGFTIYGSVGFGAAVTAGAIAGFVGGFAGGLLNGASIGGAFKAGLYGAASGAAAGVIGGAFGGTGDYLHEAARALAHGVAQGTVADMQGGSFVAGFASGAAASFVGHKGPQYQNYSSNLIKAAVIGGTASRIGGGKFENGAVSGAFTFMFNQAMTQAAIQSSEPKVKVTVLIEEPDPNSTTKIGRKGMSGHTGIAIGDDYYDYGPQPGEGRNIMGSQGRSWWDGMANASGDASLADVIQFAQANGIKLRVFTMDVSVSQADLIKAYWKDLYADPGTYHFAGRQCTSAVSQSLRQASVTNFRVMKPSTFVKKLLQNGWIEQ